MRLKRQN